MMKSSTPRLAASAAPASEPAIATDDLTRIYGKRAVVDGVTLRVPQASVYGLIGLNGAGKSTTIRMIMGLTEPTSGTITLNGRPGGALSWQSRIGVGYVPDRAVAHPWMRVSEAVAFTRGLQPKWNDELARALIEQYRLRPSEKVGKLSKGLSAKLSLLLALGAEPDVLVLDEPTDGLDPVSKEDFIESVLASACDRSRTILMSSHNLDDLQRLSDHVGLMHEGKLVLQCPVEDLVQSTKRLRMVVHADAVPSRPQGALHTRREGRELVVTIGQYSQERAARVAEEASATLLGVEDLSLNEIFKDFVRGQEVRP